MLPDTEQENTMRVFVAGASGAIGTRLVPQLIDRGHAVIGTFKSPGRGEGVRALGAEPIVLDLLDARAVRPGPVRKGQFPIVGAGGGLSSSIHLDDAAAATVLALEHDGAAIYNIVDDEPAPMRESLPVLANALGAKPPRHFQRWLARLAAGEAAVMIGTESRGASNARAKRELGWALRYPSWREGFVAAYASGHADGWTQISSGRGVWA
jgi:nucleoside-diphosphate-sugar epimerase